MFNPAELEQIRNQGITLEQIEDQIQKFKQGFPFLPLERAATIGDGLGRFGSREIQDLVETFEQGLGSRKIYKFVPASGAASRMFKGLMEFLNHHEGQNLDIDSIPWLSQFFGRLSDFAFYDQLNHTLADEGGVKQLMGDAGYDQIVRGLLERMNYSNLPKGLLTFHRYSDYTRTALEEHLVEGAAYCKGSNRKVHLHFTVSPEHQSAFEDLLRQVLERYETLFDADYDISYSQQRSSTNTIAVDLDNHPFRLDNGEILFRPGGHGALLTNLNDIDGDLVFIKNVDNVVPDRLKGETITHKKVIGGLLLKLQQQVFSHHRRLVEDGEVDLEFLTMVTDFVENSLSIQIPAYIKSAEASRRRRFIIEKLNRPIRVCGIVENTGEPGGGPFWVANSDATLSLQIAETAQIDMEDPRQLEIFKSSTHFSPTDLVCGLKNYKGEKFNLPDFVDPQTGFVAQKSQGGKELKALELPGLWNGSMSNWNTIFVEVPLITFNPVKTINDLLRPEHGPSQN